MGVCGGVRAARQLVNPAAAASPVGGGGAAAPATGSFQMKLTMNSYRVFGLTPGGPPGRPPSGRPGPVPPSPADGVNPASSDPG